MPAYLANSSCLRLILFYSSSAERFTRVVIKGAILSFIFPFWLSFAQDQEALPPVPPTTLLYRKVTDLCQSRNFEQARALINSEESRILNPKQRLEILGMIETYAGDHVLAESHFEQWCGLAPESHVARFNLGESFFLQKNFDRAVIHFSTAETLATHAGASEVAELSRYKRVLSLLALARIDDANDLIGEFTWNDATPAKRLIDATLHFRAGKWLKARELLKECGALFTPQVNDLYVDSLLELGWVIQQEDGSPSFRVSP